ncbi:hypothetical protein F5887DRAFT_290170 [Amanita rubescens]|nr:hypothetical protein F5887DRAFT_290170 [Amanita rubescens]
MLSCAEAAIVATSLQATLTGVHFTTFLLCLRWQTYSDDGWSIRKNIQWPMLIITFLTMAFDLIDLGGTVQTVLVGLKGDNYLPTSLIALTYTAKVSLVIATDGVMIYRCWVVYGKSWYIIAFPAVLLLFNFLAMVINIYWNLAVGAEVQVIPLTQVTFNQRINHMEEAALFATIFTNIYATSAIIIKIFRNVMPGRRMRSTFIFTIRVITESGLVYTITSILLLISFDPIAGIAYNLILIRVAQNRAEPPPNSEIQSIVVKNDKNGGLNVEQGVHRNSVH